MMDLYVVITSFVICCFVDVVMVVVVVCVRACVCARVCVVQIEIINKQKLHAV